MKTEDILEKMEDYDIYKKLAEQIINYFLNTNPEIHYQNSYNIDNFIENDYDEGTVSQLLVKIPSKETFVGEVFNIIFMINPMKSGNSVAGFIREFNGMQNVIMLSQVTIEDAVHDEGDPEEIIEELKLNILLKRNIIKPALIHELSHYFDFEGGGQIGTSQDSLEVYANRPEEIEGFLSQIISSYEEEVESDVLEKHSKSFEEFYDFIKFNAARYRAGVIFQYGTEETLEQVRNDLYNYWEERISKWK